MDQTMNGSVKNTYLQLTQLKQGKEQVESGKSQLTSAKAQIESGEAALKAAGFSQVTTDHHPAKPWIAVLAKK